MDEKPDFNKRVEQYIKLRDLIKEKDEAHKVEMAPYRETLEKLNSVLLQHLTDVGADRVGSSSGTVYRTEKKTAPVADKSVFWTFVTEHGNWDLIDYKANPTAVAD